MASYVCDDAKLKIAKQLWDDHLDVCVYCKSLLALRASVLKHHASTCIECLFQIPCGGCMYVLKRYEYERGRCPVNMKLFYEYIKESHLLFNK